MPTTILADASVYQAPMIFPEPRGEASALVVRFLSTGRDEGLTASVQRQLVSSKDVLLDEDIQLALFCLYEMHYGGFQNGLDDIEWSPIASQVTGLIEVDFEAALRQLVAIPEVSDVTAEGVAQTLFNMTDDQGGPSLSRYLAGQATLEQAREFLVHRSVATLKEADPHSFAIPRLSGRAKAALVEIQSDEYGTGHPGRVHSTMFAHAMRAVGLDDAYGAYINAVPAATLVAANMMSLFGLHRRLRGAIIGHLAAFEMTSSVPNRGYGKAFKRLGFGTEVTAYFDEHVEVDAVHEQIAARKMAGGLVEAEPALLEDVLFGAAACLEVDSFPGRHMREAWQAGSSSLRRPLVSV